jgi:hypothetical protein
VAALGAALLQSKQLLGAEGLVVDLAGGLDQVLQVGAGEEVAEVDELAVSLVLDVDHAPAVLATADLLAVDDDGLLTADDGEGDDLLYNCQNQKQKEKLGCGEGRGLYLYLNLSVDRALLIIELVIIVGVHLEVVEGELLLNALLEGLALLKGQGVGLGDNGDDVDDVGELLENDDIDGLETEFRENQLAQSILAGRHKFAEKRNSRMAGGLDEEQAAVDTGILDITLTLRGKLLAEVCRVLVLDVLDNGVPAEIC